MAKIRTHYDNLKIARNAPDALIKAAYKVLMQQHHPDRVEKVKEAEALRITKIIGESYSVLSDPVQRAEHDKWIIVQESQAKEHSKKPDIDANVARENEDLRRREAEKEEARKQREASDKENSRRELEARQEEIRKKHEAPAKEDLKRRESEQAKSTSSSDKTTSQNQSDWNTYEANSANHWVYKLVAWGCFGFLFWTLTTMALF